MLWRKAKWTILLAVGGAVLMFALIAWFYAFNQKGLAIRVIAAVSPATKVLPRLTENWRLSAINVRLYDGLVVLTMAAEGLVVGAAIDIIRYVRDTMALRDRLP